MNKPILDFHQPHKIEAFSPESKLPVTCDTSVNETIQAIMDIIQIDLDSRISLEAPGTNPDHLLFANIAMYKELLSIRLERSPENEKLSAILDYVSNNTFADFFPPHLITEMKNCIKMARERTLSII